MNINFKENVKLIKYGLILFFIIILFYLVWLIYKKNNKESYENNNLKIEIIVSRYNENLEWLNNKMFHKYPITIYNKGVNTNFYKPPSLKEVIPLSNVGVCDHTYLYHIIKNYDNLPDTTIFLPGSSMDDNKKDRTLNVLKKTIETNDTVIFGNYDNNGILNSLYNFNLSNYYSSNYFNKLLNNDSELRPCDIKPYGKWFQTVFGDLNIYYATYLGIFSVSKKHIQNRNLDFYKKLIKYVDKDKNEESAHYIERSYIAIFHPLPNKCIY